jgi:hypothetical protein
MEQLYSHLVYYYYYYLFIPQFLIIFYFIFFHFFLLYRYLNLVIFLQILKDHPYGDK